MKPPTIDPATITTARKADRATMVAMVAGLCVERGIPYETEDPWIYGDRSAAVRILPPDGPHLTIYFDGSQPRQHRDAHVLSWHVPLRNGRRIADTFCNPSSINRYHQHKATDLTHGFDNLMRLLADRLDKIGAGLATEPEPPAKP